jgi:hypothetical protein
VWMHAPAGSGQHDPAPGLAASLAAGLVRCDGTAHVVEVRVDRGLYLAADAAEDVETRHGKYLFRRARPGGQDPLMHEVQNRLTELEIERAASWRAQAGTDDLLVVDGSLRGRTQLPRTVSYIKSHQRAYLAPPQAQVVAELAVGQRTPVFAVTTSWPRLTWYLRLPGAGGTSWSAVARLECSAELPPDDAVRLADLSARILPRLAGRPHKDPRAPQNLVPIGGLERQLRHRLGDPALLYRALRRALSDRK